MFKKLKEKITEDLKSSPQRFQQLTQSVTDRLTTNNDDNFFSIGDDDANTSTNSAEAGFSSVSLVSPSDARLRRNSNSSIASDVSFLPRYESSQMYQLQSDLDVSASEVEDNASSSSQLGHLSKEQIYSAFQKSQMRYHKYRGRYTDLAKHYKELERENGKMKSVLVETQDKAIRRVRELKEQCSLEQKAKAHLESVLRDDIDEKQFKIQTLETKIGLLSQENRPNLVNVESVEATESLNEARAEIEALNGKIQELKASAIVFQSKEQDYKKKIADMEKEISQFSEREKEGNLNLAQNKMELHNEILNKDAEILNLKKDIEALHEKQAPNVKMENLQTQNAKLIERVENLTQKSNNLESELLKVEKYKLEIQNLDRTLQELRNNESRVKEDYENQILEIRESAKKGLLSLEGKIREKLGGEFAEKEAQMREEFKIKLGELNTNGVKEIQLKLMEKESCLEKLYQDLNTLESEKQQYKDLEKNHLELIEDSTRLRNTIANLEKELSTIKNESLEYTEKISRLQANINTLQEDLDESTETLRRKEYECLAVKTHLEENIRLTEELRELKSLENTESKLLELKQSKMDHHHQDNNSISEDYKRLTELVPDLEFQMQMLNDKIEDLKEELKSSNDLVTEKEMKISKLEENVDTLRDNLEETGKILRLKEEECLKVTQEKTHLDEKLRLTEEKRELDVLEATESKLLTLKLTKLEETNDELTKDLEAQLLINRELKQEVKKIEEIAVQREKLMEESKQIAKAFEEEKTKIIEDFEEERQANEEKLFKVLEEKEKTTDKLKKTIDDLKNKIESLTVMNEALDSEIKDREDEVKTMRKKIEELSDVIKKQTEDFSSLLERSNQLDAVVEKLQNDHANTLRKEKNAQNELSRKIEDCEKESAVKIEEINALKVKLEELSNVDKEHLKTLQNTNEDLKGKITKLEANEDTLKMLGEEKQVVEQELTRLKIVESDFKNLQEEFKSNVEELKKITEQLDSSNENLNIVTEERDVLAEEIKLLKQQNEDLEKIEEKLAKSKIENEDVNFKLDKAKEEMSELNLRVNQISSDNNHLSEENQELLGQVEELKVKMEVLEEERVKFEENSKTPDMDILKIQRDCYEIKEKCDCLFIENNNLKQEISALEEKCDNFGALKKKYEAQIEELERQYSEIQHERQLLQDEVQELKISPLNLQNNLEQKKTDSADSKEIDSLRDKLTQYKSLDITNKSSIEFYEGELQKMKNKNDKLSRKLDETLVTLNHCAELGNSTEVEYLKNVLYNYMLGKESLVLARVIAAVCKFDEKQTDAVIQKEQQKQTLLGHLGIL
ncbi:unnamed protein product [Brassicogethes aeneus]|uniref:GRIP domain-containing protein n=1 Tax=Brassicogethes aeneus TaxID=1431903 RepID=A0A9P0FBA3_BRAAE|nr:unnamed protein product [Brassicogethes aeneus]